MAYTNRTNELFILSYMNLWKKILVGYDDRFLVIIMSIGLSMAFLLAHVFIKKCY